MQTHGLKIAGGLVASLLSASGLALAARADQSAVNGMITTRTGDALVVRGSGGDTTVILTAGTRTKDDRGLFGLGKQELSDVVLIPGLKVSVDGEMDGENRFVAKTITVDGDDLETAEMVQAGLHPTAEQVAANMRILEAHQQSLAGHTDQLASHNQSIQTNQQGIATNSAQIGQNIKDIQENTDRFDALSDFDVKGQATLHFNTGSSKLSSGDEEQLKQLAQSAAGTKGYIVEVTGYADSTGNAAVNTSLSENRAKAAITYLVQQGGIPIRHIVAPGAMGEYGAAAPNETKQGRAENRRVDVKILVNKGIAGV